MNQQSSDEASANNSPVKFISILVVVLILGIIIFKLTTSGEDPSSKDSPTSHSVTEDKESSEKAIDVANQSLESPAKKEAAELVDNKNAQQNVNEIYQFLEDWKSAWQLSAGPEGKANTYFSFYSDSFTDGKLSKDQWQTSKQLRNQGKSWIEVWVSDIKISKNDAENYTVTFKQEYSSSNYSDKGAKELVVKKTDTSWEILSERGL